MKTLDILANVVGFLCPIGLSMFFAIKIYNLEKREASREKLLEELLEDIKNKEKRIKKKSR